MLSRRSEVINSRREGLTLTEFNVVEGLQRRFNRVTLATGEEVCNFEVVAPFLHLMSN